MYAKHDSWLATHMNFFKRATTSIIRRPGKTIILLLLVFILGSVIAGAISVNGAINNTDANLRARMPAIATAYFDHEAFNESMNDLINWDEVDWEAGEDPWRDFWNSREILTSEHVHAIEQLDYVASADYIIRSWMETFDLERYVVEIEGGIDIDIGMWGQPDGLAGFALFGGSSTELVHVQNNIIYLTQGDPFETSDLVMRENPNRSVAIISEELANLNGLSVGQTFIISRTIPLPLPPGEWFDNWADQFLEENIYAIIELEVEIVGLFDLTDRITNPTEDQEEEYRQQADRLNNIYLPNWAIEELDRQAFEATLASWDSVDFEFDPMYHWLPEGDQETEVIPVFTLTDPELFDEFGVAAEELLPEYYSLVDMMDSFENVASSMGAMRDIAFWVLWISVGATLLILSLLITLFLRDRRYEMGVYLALGEKKGKIISQILMEVVVTSLIGITFAVFAGHFISSAMSQGMLENQLVAQQNDQDRRPDHFDPGSHAFENIGIPRTEMTPEEMMEAFEITFSFETISLFYIVGLGAVILSTTIPVIYVVTLKPKKVLM